MAFRIADTFTSSIAKLTGDEQKAVKTTAFDLQMNPASPGMKLHRVDKAKDKRFWSVRVSRDIRLIVHKTDASLLLCYVDHHDEAYRWAESRKLERHPKTGAAQLVTVRETVRDITVPRYVVAEEPAEPVAAKSKSTGPALQGVSAEDLLGYGVPSEWVDDVLEATEETLLNVVEHLPAEAGEAVLELATGGTPAVASVAEPDVGAATEGEGFEHPDAQRRFRLMTNVEELQRALDFPWERWSVFLHPAQRSLVERQYNGPARVAGSAGTGKTVVALHRAVHLARRDRAARVLVTTFSEALANSLRHKLAVLVGNEPAVRERITVRAIDAVGLELYRELVGEPTLAKGEQIDELLREEAADVSGHSFSERFLRAEWDDVVDAWQLRTWEAYRDVPRLGKKKRLGERQRQVAWDIFGRARSGLRERGLVTMPEVFGAVAEALESGGERPYDHAVVDEAQDVGVAQLGFLAALAGGEANGLFFAGDLGQRIFQTPFSWKSLGVDVRGRSQSLKINYRTSHQIRRQADLLLPSELADVDQNTEKRKGTVSVFNGPEPEMKLFDEQDAEAEAVAAWLQDAGAEGAQPHEIGVFVRTTEQLSRAIEAVDAAGLKHVELDGKQQPDGGAVSVATMHLAKGLEFRAVVVMACDEDVLPLQERVEAIGDEADLEEVFNTERHLLYVACTRARDRLLVTGLRPGSEFVDDLESGVSEVRRD